MTLLDPTKWGQRTVGQLCPKPLAIVLVRFGIALAIADVTLHLEALRVTKVAGPELAGPWELVLIEKGAPGLAMLPLIPLFALLSLFGPLLRRAESLRGRIAWGIAASGVATWLAILLSTGKKASELSVRVPFVVGLGAAVGLGVVLFLPTLVRAARRSEVIAPLWGITLGSLAFVADARVLPRLYPVFHFALYFVQLVSVVLIAEGIAALLRRGPFLAEAAAIFGMFHSGRAVAKVPWAGPEFAIYDNARRVVDERSLPLGRAVALSSLRFVPRPFEELSALTEDPLGKPVARALDATDRDVLLVTIDALRADHVGAYGYKRNITPNLDRLAQTGAAFSAAYTPTPHTSYAVSSLMTGKYMRPLLHLEAATGQGRTKDDTFAGLFRAHGYRTAAFYPPAIFHVDGERFNALRERGLDFEYSKVEFATPDLRAKQVSSYLATAPSDRHVFVWVHLFEPHEPYVPHAKYPLGDTDMDRYDAEIAVADDGLGAIVAAMRAARPNAIVVVTADHGEAFGEHNARYHGTTVYEEQVRVPLVISAPPLIAPMRVAEPVQLIDIMPTVFSMVGIARPARVRGRDLGPLLSGHAHAGEGVAYAEVDDATMFASDSYRLVCSRRTDSCALYDVMKDPSQLVALSGQEERIRAMRRTMASVVAASAELEGFTANGKKWPEALTRAMAGEATAAADAAGLLDDVDPKFRLKSAEALARLGVRETLPQIVRALGRERDDIVRSWLLIGALRIRSAHEDVTIAEIQDLGLLVQGDGPRARLAALVLGTIAARNKWPIDPITRSRALDRGLDLLSKVQVEGGDLARAVIQVIPPLANKVEARLAVAPLLAALDDIRLRAVAADALGQLGEPSALPALLTRVAAERHLDARAPLALAIGRLGARERAWGELQRMLGVPDPAPGADLALVELARTGTKPKWLALAGADGEVTATLELPKSLGVGASVEPPRFRLILVGLRAESSKVRITPRATVGDLDVEGVLSDAGGIVELSNALVGKTQVVVRARAAAVALVMRVDDLPPPKRDRSVEDLPVSP